MNTQKLINSSEELNEILATQLAVLLYFSTASCSVGEAFEPKVKMLINSKFPKIKFYNVDLNFSPKIAAEHSAFVEPTILVFFDGKETIRKSRNISIYELEEAIKRPYELIFE
ncbi:thioredoxin family protein [Lutibacter oceani]|nr:thioredoxin family protein [Lutibacter oceani]